MVSFTTPDVASSGRLRKGLVEGEGDGFRPAPERRWLSPYIFLPRVARNSWLSFVFSIRSRTVSVASVESLESEVAMPTMRLRRKTF